MLDCRRDITTALIYVFIYLGQLGKRGGTDLKNQWRSKCILHSNKGIYKKNYARTVIQYFWEGFRRNQHNKRCNYQKCRLYYSILAWNIPVCLYSVDWKRSFSLPNSEPFTLSWAGKTRSFAFTHSISQKGRGFSNIVLRNNVGLCFTGWPNMFYKTF